MAEEAKGIYNQVTLFNYDNEDFIFRVDSIPYIIKAGDQRNFPKFMAALATKHFVDKMMIKADPEGKLLLNKEKRLDAAARFVIDEQPFEEPKLPTQEEVIESMNQPSDLEQALSKPKTVTPLTTAPPPVKMPEPDYGKVETPVIENTAGVPTPEQLAKANPTVEKFDQLEEEKKLPARKEMMSYAKDVLKLDLSNEKIVKRLDSMSDKKLYDELQMGK